MLDAVFATVNRSTHPQHQRSSAKLLSLPRRSAHAYKLSLFFLEDYCKCHTHKAQKRDGWTNHDAARAEDIGVELVKLIASTKHQQKANHNHCAANCHQHKVDESERKIAIFNLIFFPTVFF